MKYLIFVLLLLLSGLPQAAATGLPDDFAGQDDEEDSQQPERAEVDYQRLLLQAMLEQVDEEEIVHLDLDAERSFLLLYREAMAAQPKGDLVLLPGEGQHPNWPVAIAPLRQELAAHGWTTWALSLPQYQPLGPPSRTLPPGPLLSRLGPEQGPPADDEEDPGDAGGAFDEPSEESADSSEVRDPAERLADQQAAVEERLLAVLNHQEGGGRQLLALQGEAVFWLLPWLEAGSWPEQSPLLLLNVRVPEGADSRNLARVLRGLGDRPILDIYDPASSERQRHAEERKAAYLRAGNDQAVQLSLESSHGQRQSSQDRWLIQRVEGWLRSL